MTSIVANGEVQLVLSELTEVTEIRNANGEFLDTLRLVLSERTYSISGQEHISILPK